MLLFFFIAVPLFILCSRSSCFLVFDFFLNEFPVLYPIFSLLILDLLTSSLKINDFYVRIEFRWYFPHNDNSKRFYVPFHFFKAYTEFLSGCSDLILPLVQHATVLLFGTPSKAQSKQYSGGMLTFGITLIPFILR